MSNTFNEYFTNITKNLNLPESKGNTSFEKKRAVKIQVEVNIFQHDFFSEHFFNTSIGSFSLFS